MPLPRSLVATLRSLLALSLAIVAIPLVNMAGEWVSGEVFGLPGGRALRLAADLFWVFMAGFTGTWLMVKVAAAGKTAHAWTIFAIYLVVDVLGAIEMWDEFPRWFTIGVLVVLPPQVWLGWWLAWGRARRGRRARAPSTAG